MSLKSNITTSGATCVSALIVQEGTSKTLYIANAGDSRAVLAQYREAEEILASGTDSYKAIRLSVDHSAENPSEQVSTYSSVALTY